METTVDTDLDRLISRRASEDRSPDPDEQEELWKASVRRHHEAIRRTNRALWYAWHRDHALAQLDHLAKKPVERD